MVLSKKQKRALQAIKNNALRERTRRFMQKQNTQAPRIRTITAPLAKTQVSVSSRPNMNGSKNLHVNHRELFGIDDTGSNAFTLHKIVINPANDRLFRWFSGIGARFDKYQFKRLTVRYRSRVPATSAGFLRISFDPDVLDANPADMEEMAMMRNSQESAIWSNFEMHVPAQCLVGKRYTCLNPPLNSDAKTYHIGALYVALQGFTGPHGTFEIDYDVDLFDPTPLQEASGQITFDHADLTIPPGITAPLMSPDAGLVRKDASVPVEIVRNVSASDLGIGSDTYASVAFKFIRPWIGVLDLLAVGGSDPEFRTSSLFHNLKTFNNYQSSAGVYTDVNSSIAIQAEPGQYFIPTAANDASSPVDSPTDVYMRFMDLTEKAFRRILV
jgi:hypothetical protein